MQINKIYFTSAYLKACRKLPKNLKNIQDKKEQIFRENVFDPSLKTHKLKGKRNYFLRHWYTRDL